MYLKEISDTRWSSKASAIHALNSQLKKVVDILEEVLDTIIMQMKERFVADDFGFLNGVSIKKTNLDELKKQATDLADLNAYEFTSEIESFKFQSKILYTNFIEMGLLEILQDRDILNSLAVRTEICSFRTAFSAACSAGRSGQLLLTP
ncbi:unnamed protein product [Psylliodes chrysocephalus]|uniref:Uncharacterized protein n=1 Tax=Psylliodes chrysocephalus TaxID=3402493 RepID=A0A9P0G9Q2_9CUCU|nr:unnamed protein product [Psylliodes chrysocephala]